jgi:N-methylhydantoinase A
VDDIASIRQSYDEQYARFFDRPVPGSDVEIMSYAVVVTTEPEHVAGPPRGSQATTPATPERTQLVRDTTTGAQAEWRIYDRAALTPSAAITGPAIVVEAETSTLIGPGWSAVVTALGYIELTRDA